MSFTIYNYEYHLEGYPDKTFSLKEYKTFNINNDDNDNCPIVKFNSNNMDTPSQNVLTSSISSMSSSLSSDSSLSTKSTNNLIDLNKEVTESEYNIENYKIIRSCDHFNSNIIETDKNVDLVIKDKNKELEFNLKYHNININSYDLMKMINKFGSKKLQKNYEYKKIFQYFRNSDVLKLYDINSALLIIKKVQSIFRNRLKEIKNNCIDTFNFTTAFENTNKIWEQNNEKIDKQDLKEETLYNYIDTFMISLTDLQKQNDFTHVKLIKPESNEKLIVFGDFHGSFATFVRHLLRFKKIGIINENGKIKDGYSIIFLGDIVDRGIYSYEILMILYLLIINNPNQIILISGNHEELETNGRLNRNLYSAENITNSKSYIGNFINEILGKFRKLEETLKIYTEIINIMRLQPSALIVQDPINTNKYIYMAHGCLPHDQDNVNLLNDYFKKKFMEKKSFCISNDIGISIRWNDFHGKKETQKSVRTYNNNKEIQTIGKNILHDAHNIGIATVIRGHEDLYFNTKIMEDESDEWISINEDVIEDGKKYAQKLLCKNQDDKLGNMTHTIQLNNNTNKLIINQEETNYLPILTIATNTDIGKNLTSDSYIIIAFSKSVFPKCSQNGGKCYKHKFIKYSNKIN